MLLKGNDVKYKKESGVLMHISCLPSRHGIGDFGREAYRFVDFLKSSRQTYWQLLPLCPVGKGNSPYSSLSTFAGEILFIDLDGLVSDGLLSPDEIPEAEFPKNTDYRRAREFKLPLIKKAAERFNPKSRDFKAFLNENSYWLYDYALFMAIKEVYRKKSFTELDDGLKYRLPEAVERFKKAHTEQILFYEITQYFFFSQYLSLKKYAAENGVKIIGDIPFYVQLESADVWSNPDIFRLGRDMTPVLVAGVPPDCFSADGQLWGNPIYNWDYQKATDYEWWRRRLVHNAKLYDVIRIDHFRAFADYYTIPYGAQNARSGVWEKGVGLAFWNLMKPYVNAEIIAEDLGGNTPEVEKLIEDTGFPNMKVLQFAFDSDLENPFLPKNYNRNCVCYTGTHDNDTTRGWFEKAGERERTVFSHLVPADKSGSAVFSLISFAMKSKARMVIIPIQDYLQLDSCDRFNTPGVPSGNWEWRLSEGDLTDELSDVIKRLCAGRNDN
ncbi:MAG: 4-alpha-glucanotransferase [Acutalibacteraceae bacterium]